MAWDDETWGSGSGPDGYRLWEFDVSWTSPGSSTFVSLPQINVAEFDAEFCRFSRSCIPQPRPMVRKVGQQHHEDRKRVDTKRPAGIEARKPAVPLERLHKHDGRVDEEHEDAELPEVPGCI